MKGGGVLSDNYNNEHIPQRPVKKSRKKARKEPLLFMIKILLRKLPQTVKLPAEEVKRNPPAKNRHGQNV